MLAEKQLIGIVDELAAPTPAPGGGSAAALAGALSASLTLMVAGLTLGKKKYQAVEAEMKAVAARATSLKDYLLKLADEDAEAYRLVVSRRGKPGYHQAVEQAARVPLKTAQACLDALGLSLAVLEKGNPNAKSDGGVAAYLARAGLIGALMNVSINLADLPDPKPFLAQARELSRQARELMGKIEEALGELIEL